MQSTTFTVTNAEDNGSGSLREAIAVANASPGDDEITFSPSLTGETISLTSGELRITDHLVIRGLGAENLTIDSQGNSSVFNIDYYQFNYPRAMISALTITGGGGDNSYPGIISTSYLTITDTKITGHSIGIDHSTNYGISLTVTNSTISENSEIGIRNFSGSLSITNSSILGNSTGIYNNRFRGVLNINNSTISGNTGGGIKNGYIANITNSTISGNSTDDYGGGGGIFTGGTLNIRNSTISNNSSNYGGGGISFGNNFFDNEIYLANTIVSGNFNVDLENDRRGNITSAGGNLIGTGRGIETFNQPGDIVSVTLPGLEPLADNGGPTLTHALESNSPAVNSGIDAGGLTTDQRGFPRRLGPGVDIGAFESDFTELPVPTVSIIVVDPVATEGGLDGLYRLSRTGNTDSPLTVQLKATASSGLSESDFTLTGVSGSFPDFSVTIPGGESFVELSLIAQADAEIESLESLTLDFAPNNAYRAGTLEAVVNIVSETLTVVNNNNSGPGSLRETIKLANIAPGNNFIEFDPALGGETISLTSGELLITDDLIIRGLGAENLTIAAQGNSGVFILNNGYQSQDPANNVSISGLSITGAQEGTYNNFSRGAIYNRENLTISDIKIHGNNVTGIFNDGDLTISNSTISGNSSDFNGGGIFNVGDLIINKSTISGNSSGFGAGGIAQRGNLIISNSTISGNSSNSDAGGIQQNGFRELRISNSTITLNQGGGIASSTNVEIANTIISGNFESDINLSNNITSNGGNLIGTGNGLEAFNQPTDQINITDPGLAPLRDNGGPTLTHLPLSDSSAVDAGVNASIPPGVSTDQRGLARIFNSTVDIGSVELQSVNTLLGTPGRDTLIGGVGNDSITGFGGRDELTGGDGSDQFIYTSVTEGVDIITDFQVNQDRIVLGEVLASLDYTGNNAISDSYLNLISSGENTLVQIDPDGLGSARARDFILVQNVGVGALNNPKTLSFSDCCQLP
ncbi:choice-of-anchor Q domain-containing protein [Gloeocapsa sp. PCC 73106]|uniref:choice-of-anchor Q domain-containing protein n=1 Tax=Gloeocapsa sp. PCC 73106 TaxID=102232 RepID=UPI0002E433C1|nr:choice-of-anchor Q domain-containing protein [Gloeocapsa sp. PCC 73106]